MDDGDDHSRCARVTAVWAEVKFGRLGVTSGPAFWLAHLGRGDLIGQADKHGIGVRGPIDRQQACEKIDSLHLVTIN